MRKEEIDYKTKTSELLDDHFVNGKIKCLYCSDDKYLASKHRLSIHITKYHAYDCSECEKKFKTLGAKLKHVKSEHNNDSFRCTLCEPHRNIDKWYEFIRHMYKVHENKVKDEDKTLVCAKENCDKKFSTEFMHQRHLDLHNVEDKKPIVCRICDSRFENEARLQIHAKVHQRTKLLTAQTRIHRPVKCTDCDETFIKSGKLKLHMDRSHPKPEDEKTCPQCDKRFLSDLLLRNHVYRQHTKVYKKIKCDECEDEFKDRRVYDTHKIQKHGAEPLVCEECGEKMMTKSGLRIHKLSHTGIKPHKCHICDASFLKGSTLRNHIAAHSAERPFICHCCPQAFKTKKTLESHINRIHSKDYIVPTPFPCTYCGKAYSTRPSRDAHIRQVHTGERPYVCSVSGCDKGFAVKTSLTTHMKTSHGIVGPKKDRAPKSKRDEDLPPSYSSSARIISNKDKKARRNLELSESDTSESSMNEEDN